MAHRVIKKGIGALFRLLHGHGVKCRCPECSTVDHTIEVVEAATELGTTAAKAASKSLDSMRAPSVVVTIDGKPAKAEFVKGGSSGKKR